MVISSRLHLQKCQRGTSAIITLNFNQYRLKTKKMIKLLIIMVILSNFDRIFIYLRGLTITRRAAVRQANSSTLHACNVALFITQLNNNNIRRIIRLRRNFLKSELIKILLHFN